MPPGTEAGTCMPQRHVRDFQRRADAETAKCVAMREDLQRLVDARRNAIGGDTAAAAAGGIIDQLLRKEAKHAAMVENICNLRRKRSEIEAANEAANEAATGLLRPCAGTAVPVLPSAPKRKKCKKRNTCSAFRNPGPKSQPLSPDVPRGSRPRNPPNALVLAPELCTYAVQPANQYIDGPTLEIHLRFYNEDRATTAAKPAATKKKCAICRTVGIVNSMKYVESGEFECPICMEILPHRSGMLFECGHVTCNACTSQITR